MAAEQTARGFAGYPGIAPGRPLHLVLSVLLAIARPVRLAVARPVRSGPAHDQKTAAIFSIKER